MLEALPVDLAMEVLRSMPGSFLSNFSHLPPALQPIAALADYPALAAAFMPPVEGLHTDAALPTVMLCVDINPDAVATAPGPSDTTMHGTETSQDMANQEIWLDSNQEVDGQSLFFLNKRAGTVACHLLARSTKLHVLKIKLPDNVCIVFGAGTLHLKNVTFEGVQKQSIPGPCTMIYKHALILMAFGAIGFIVDMQQDSFKFLLPCRRICRLHGKQMLPNST